MNSNPEEKSEESESEEPIVVKLWGEQDVLGIELGLSYFKRVLMTVCGTSSLKSNLLALAFGRKRIDQDRM
ncbi:MAG: hypothetical protein ACK52I_13955 [Pseudomonadota bacterium]